jgi:hypothetical protein
VWDALPADEVVLDAQPVAGTAVSQLPPPIPTAPWYKGPPLRVLGRAVGLVFAAIASLLEWLLGAVMLVVTLAVLAALPILNFLSLGYLLEASARVARTGKLSEGFIGVRLAARLGGAVAMCYLLLVPVRLVSGLAHAAYVIEPGGAHARLWRVLLLVLIAVTALHLLATLARGGKLRYFFWPFNFVWLIRRIGQGGYFAQARDATWEVVAALQLPYFFWLGVRGFVVAFAWLVLPVSMMVAGNAPIAVAPLVGWLGALLLGLVVLYLPFAQLRLAETGRMRDAFDIRTVREAYRRAPWAFAIAFTFTLLLAVPLYLLKIEPVPREVAWLPSVVFIVFIFPARLLAGWAMACAHARTQWAHWFFRWTGRLAMVPVVLFYLLIVYFAQFVSWNGVWSLYEQHAFSLPVPFFGI